MNTLAPQASVPNLLNEAQAATYLGISPKTLQQWRWRGDGTPFIKLGGKMIRYRKSDLDQFIANGFRRSTSDRG